jgi:hypothetical protein
LFLEQAEGYRNTLEKSTSQVLSWREVFEHGAQNDEAGGKRLNVVLKVLSFVLSDEPNRTRTDCDKFVIKDVIKDDIH